MRRNSSGCSSRLGAVALLLLASSTAHGQAVVLRRAEAACEAVGSASRPPTEWRPVILPFTADGCSSWVRLRFRVDAQQLSDRSFYLPYLYGGGDLYINGALVQRIAASTAERTVRWERPFLIPIPAAMLRAGENEFLLRAAPEPVTAHSTAPPVTFGSSDTVADLYESRLFRVRTMSQLTALLAGAVGILAAAIWWRRREEVLYGIFGFASLLWGVRTLNLVIESLATPWWDAWRLVYLWSTGGFAIALVVFELRVAGRRWPRFERASIVYGLACPVLYALSAHDDWLVGKLWTGGLLPISLVGACALLQAAWKRPSAETVALAAVVVLSVVAGVHDYLVHAASPALAALMPDASADRLFRLQYSADLLLVLMAGILSARFVRALGELAAWNRTLEARIAERERVLTDKFQVIGALERRHAADEERERLLRDLHDGLGSRLFVTLTQVESNAIVGGNIAQALRECIADMRLTFEVLKPDDGDFMTAWGDFRFRWKRELDAVHIASDWRAEPADSAVALGAEATLQLLRIAQEALTNVIKHARATHVDIGLKLAPNRLRIEVTDDGLGLPAATNKGRGIDNMRARARAVGARLNVGPAAGAAGTTVWLEVDIGERPTGIRLP